MPLVELIDGPYKGMEIKCPTDSTYIVVDTDSQGELDVRFEYKEAAYDPFFAPTYEIKGHVATLHPLSEV